MPPKTIRKRLSKKDSLVSNQTAKADVKPQPPNIFLYIQLANIKSLPTTIHPLEIHIEQGDSLIVKCEEHYNTDGYIYQNEFDARPTFTLIFQQDNIDRINQAVDNPLLIKLYMHKSELPHFVGEEEEEDGAGDSEIVDSKLLLPMISEYTGRYANEMEDIDYYAEKKTLVLLNVGFLDLIKLFGHRRTMIREDLFLYPVPDVPNELRSTVQSEWHLYTLLPIAKELIFTKMAFVSFESIYNIKDSYVMEPELMEVELSFRLTNLNELNEYTEILWCSFSQLTSTTIGNQSTHLVFESFRSSSIYSGCCNMPGLKSTMEVEMHKLFSQLMRSEGLEVDFQFIDRTFDDVLVSNSFHRYILTQTMSDIFAEGIACGQFVVAVDIWQNSGTRIKLFQGTLDPAILIYPEVSTMRFAVELEYVGPPPVAKSKRTTMLSMLSRNTQHTISTKGSEQAIHLPTFAIIKICLLAPLSEMYEELKEFRETFVAQNRLLVCVPQQKEPQETDLFEIRREAYLRFDNFIRETISYIVDKNVHSIEERKAHFCCALQNLTNILLKVVGSDFNVRIPTSTSVEFANLCTFAFNELELRIHRIVEKVEENGFEEAAIDEGTQMNFLVDHMNTIKVLNAVGDTRMVNFLYDKLAFENRLVDFYEFFCLINNMERGDYAAAKKYYESPKMVSEMHHYFAGWIRLYLTYVETRNNPETELNANECLLNSIIQYAEHNNHQIDGWILLYSYYRKFHYPPGYEYARWRFEDYSSTTRSSSYSTPHSTWGLILNMRPSFKTNRSNNFFDVFNVFVRLGLFEFGRVIFSTVEHDCTEADRYFINTTLSILLNDVPPKLSARTFNFDNNEKGQKMSAFNAQVNGNLEYYFGNFSAAINYYKHNIDLPLQHDERDDFSLSSWRLAYLSYAAGDYRTTIKALSKQHIGNLMPLIAHFMIGKGYYKLNHLSNALESFAQATTFETHLPDAWAYLATINLRIGNNYNALECWKYAKIVPTKFIEDEIYDELNAIDFDDVDLFIDPPI